MVPLLNCYICNLKFNYAKHGYVALALKYLRITCLGFFLYFGIVNLVILTH